ncbi:XdhC family protein [Psychrobacter sp. UBA5136]|uniref:XdhC family protein n=1 Tax=Psychrobacter sp. UBA5136 TaxID=1947356 RepID=UPI0025D5E70D|nr:XdhC/CoxI family protein [Psychrobacter sp. UBA5136]
MNHVADILKLAAEAQQQNIDAVLATVVRTEGSAYRRAGAMMLICADGRSVGMISGGCLEPHIIKRAFWLTRNGANVQIYQTGNDEADTDDDVENSVNKNDDLDNELNFGLGCNGRVHVLFERLTAAMPLLETFRHVRRSQQPKIIATLIRSNADKAHLSIGLRLDLEDSIANKNIPSISDDNLSNQPLIDNSSAPTPEIKAIITALSTYQVSDKNSEYAVLENDDIATEWLIQRLQPQHRLLICGAGNDVMPLVTMAKLQDWHVTVIDSRAQYATRLRFPQADVVMPVSLDETEKLLKLSHNAAVALMSHSLTQDRARLAVLLEHPTHYKYLGQLGPSYRTERLVNEIRAVKDHPERLNDGVKKLHYPIGYKLGGDGPEALALGIMAQINAVMHEQTPPADFLANNDSRPAVLSCV